MQVHPSSKDVKREKGDCGNPDQSEDVSHHRNSARQVEDRRPLGAPALPVKDGRTPALRPADFGP
jgi:hypothetical protein